MPYKQTYDNYYREYFKTPSGKAALLRARRKYLASDKGKAVHRAGCKRFQRNLKKRYQTDTQAEAMRRHKFVVSLRKDTNVPV